MLNWKEYLKRGIVRPTTIDKNMITSLVKTSKESLDFFKNSVPDEKNSRTLLKNYYDSLREVCEATALSKGLKIYQHEAITLFLRDILNEPKISQKFDRFRVMRNNIHYYGKSISKEEVKDIIKDINAITKFLISKYLNQYKQNTFKQ